MSKTRVAVYGSLRIGMGNNRCLDGAEFIGRCDLAGMGMVSFGSYPACDFDDNSTITIEVFDVDTLTGLPRLDMLEGTDPTDVEGTSNYYSRREVETAYGKAWVYFIAGTLEEGFPVVEHGDWVRYRTEDAA